MLFTIYHNASCTLLQTVVAGVHLPQYILYIPKTASLTLFRRSSSTDNMVLSRKDSKYKGLGVVDGCRV